MTLFRLPLQSATLERLSLDDMIAKSTSIVRGKVAGSYAVASGPSIFTHYTIQVSESFKGPAGKTMDIVVDGGVVNNVRQSFAGAPTFNTGDEYVFFLWTGGREGLTRVLGLTQGLFALATDSTTDPTATRSASHELMLDHGTGRPVKDETLTMRLSDLRSRIAAALGAPSQMVGQ